jgi:hypothetical protein
MSYQFQGNALGPVWGPNQMMVVQEKDGESYQLNIYPDYFNEQLRAAGKPMYFYYQPDKPRLAKNDDGTYKFSFVKFEGVLNADDNIDVPGVETETAGGLLAFTSTMKIPDEVITGAIKQLKDKCMNDAKYSNDSRWRMTDGMPDPELGVVPIVSNLCGVSNIANGAPKPASGDDPWMVIVEGTNVDTSVKDDKGNVIANGSTNPTGENAFTFMLGQYPAAILEQAFKGNSSPIFVSHRLQHMFYMDAFTARIEAHYDMCYTYVSAEVKAKYYWAQADVQASVSDLQKNGALNYDITINNMILTPDQQKTYQAQTDKVYEKIQDWFLKTMIDQTPAKPDPAKAADNNMCVGVSLAVKVEHDEVHEDLQFHEEISETYLQYNLISADICGLAGKMGQDAEGIKKYFQIVHLDEAFRKIHFVATANAFWPTAPGKDDGDPINQISLTASYPDSTGTLVAHSPAYVMPNMTTPKKANDLGNAIWDAGNKDSIFIFDFSRLDEDAPAEIDKSLITLQSTITYDADPRVELTEPVVQKYQTSDKSAVVTANPVGTLRVSPIMLDTDLPPQVEVSVTFTKDNRQPEVKLFNSDNAKVVQSYLAFTNQAKSNIPWSYQVEVTVKGTFPKPSIHWQGPVINKVGSGPLVVSLPDVPADKVDLVNKYLGIK